MVKLKAGFYPTLSEKYCQTPFKIQNKR